MRTPRRRARWRPGQRARRRQSGRPRSSHRSGPRPPFGCRCRPPPAMVHAGPAARAMFAAAEAKPRRAVSPLGIPKSPSFHSGLDLVAGPVAKRSESASDVARAFRFAVSCPGTMEGQAPQKAASPPSPRSPPPPAAVSPERPPQPPTTDKESLMVQLPLLKGPPLEYRLYCLQSNLQRRSPVAGIDEAARIYFDRCR